MATNTDDRTRTLVLYFYGKGWEDIDIAEELGVPESEVAEIINEFEGV